MVGMAIVAIPDDRDPTWKISSEKIPHMTLLYLGDQERDLRVPHVAEYVEHAVKSSLTRFGMSVDHRGELGPEDADVLFFNKNWTAKKLEEFRSNLLKDPVIFGMYNSVDQFPQWTPHLTLGYPEAPAKEPEGDDRIPYWVEFIKIAFWFDDFEGMEYLIPDDDRYAESAAWSDSNATDFLEHYGIKGMKWGQSRTREQIDAGVQKVKKTVAEREELKKSDKSRPVSDDAQKKSEALRVARNANLDRLSNKELQHLVTRMNLEKQYEGLTKGQNKSLENRAKDFVKEFAGIKTNKDTKNTKIADAMSQAFNSNKPEDWRSAL